jgi:GxxExxY protein
MMELIHREISGKVVHAFHEVHHHLGPGYMESIYHNALIHELSQMSIPFEKERVIEVFYKGKKVGEHRLDLVVDGKIVIELKAVPNFHAAHEAQPISYLKATGIRLGFLVNFGRDSLQYKRFVL